MNLYTSAACALLCSVPAAIVSCAPHTAQDSIDEEINSISQALDILEETTEDNAREMLAKLEKLEAKRAKMFEHRKTLPADEVKKLYYGEKNLERMGALSVRLNEEVGPAFYGRVFQAQNSTDMRKISEIVMRYCEVLPKRTAPIKRSN